MVLPVAAAEQALPWYASMPAGIGLEPDRPIPIDVWVGDHEATNIRMTVSMVDATTKNALSDGKIYGDEALSKTITTLPAKTMTRAWIKATHDSGTYTGSVTLRSDEQPAGITVASTTLYVSSLWRKLWGVFWIAFGVLVAWFTTVIARNAVNRAQLMSPAAALRDRLNAVRAQLAKASSTMAVASDAQYAPKKIQDLLTSLDIEALQAQGLPPQFPRPFSPPTTSTTINTYMTYIQTTESWVAVVEMVVAGIRKAYTLKTPGDPGSEARVRQALSTIDALVTAPAPPALSDVKMHIDSALQSAVDGRTERASAASISVGLPTMKQLTFTLNVASIASWAIVLLASVAVGSYILVFSSNGAGFGTPTDALQCVLWGLGLPYGASLLQSSTSSVSAAFNVQR
jgi:hypothetical protein